MSTYQINVIYPKTVSLYRITSLVESVSGTKIQHLNFTSQGKDYVGTLIVETSDRIGFASIVKLMRASKGLLSVVEHQNVA
ncbi:hypothetical protein [Dyadobacter frigoris]|uniref:DUF4911 domain-containing protein n=1 Tax=Dyadobacter frigoris TaxID=2576211 RepID=A0A4U6D728_9BACT|nr:hypothetical protein [Dyadobacter frigoris]TKT92275.1 hypothetical protein FDK13_09855 [Dyadobacter frigoris]GLU53455.1 hypothetical protein Dfri01_29160 [Dyadobacter frigoris]